MGAINNIVNIAISLQTNAIPQASFAVPLIAGPNAPYSNGDLVRYYSSVAGAEADGYLSTNPEIAYLTEALEQSLVPTIVGLGKRTVAVAQVDTFAVNTVTVGHAYVTTLNGVLLTYTAIGGDTQQSILGQLLTQALAISPAVVSGSVAGTGSGALLTLTSTVAGQAVAYSAIDTLLTRVALTANNGVADDLQKIINQPTNGNLWYGLCLTSQASNDILQTAAFIEGLQKIFIADSADSGIPTSSNTDILSQLKGKNYNRTALLYSAASANKGMSAAWLGGQLPQVPGASTWMFKALTGITADSFTDAARTNILGVPGVPGKNGNIYESVGGVPITENGWMVSGRYIDITVGIDWFTVTLQTNVFTLLVSNPKIPYTDQGATVIQNAIIQTIKQGITNGLIDGNSPYSVTVAPVLSVSSNTRANRISPPFLVTFRLAGAFHEIVIQATVTI